MKCAELPMASCVRTERVFLAWRLAGRLLTDGKAIAAVVVQDVQDLCVLQPGGSALGQYITHFLRQSAIRVLERAGQIALRPPGRAAVLPASQEKREGSWKV